MRFLIRNLRLISTIRYNHTISYSIPQKIVGAAQEIANNFNKPDRITKNLNVAEFKIEQRLVSLYNKYIKLVDEKKELLSMIELEKSETRMPNENEFLSDCETELDEYNDKLKDLKHEIETQYLLLKKYISESDLTENLSDGCILEVRPGVGGSESSIFAKDLLSMYLRLCQVKNWNYEIMNIDDDDSGVGINEAILEIKPKYNDGESLDNMFDENKCYSYLQFETGVHRVQRIPMTESKGRVHTSTASVLVLPMSEKVNEDTKKEIDELKKSKDVRIEVMRASGKGGQHVNTTNSAVRLTHEPTGISVYIQSERQQHRNKEKAFQILHTRMKNKREEELRSKDMNLRKSKVSNVDRSFKIRTYNYPTNNIYDHRLQEFKWHCSVLEKFMKVSAENKWDELVNNLYKEKHSKLMKEVLEN
ncbi:uncharacterized protein HGUI_00574 [Hanseniaspora guilliermondii]|uniref:Peptide chain release factor 1, mitochondrial n=1 Tax=Hanseniaspora guilliermondii TaxID=56406 RepID=A0A1L0FFL9_9ASCO|nr:uncharacterized protein HGUI_00574 [Hanseniaspora guilliermondii]